MAKTRPEIMKPIASSWIATRLVEQSLESYTPLDVRQALIEALNPTPKELAELGKGGQTLFVNHVAHVLKSFTDLKLHARPSGNPDPPYRLTDKGKAYFQKYYSDRHGR